jgi:hypothetical protein
MVTTTDMARLSLERTIGRAALLAFFLLSSFGLHAADELPAPSTKPVMVIVHRDVPLASVSQRDLADLVLGRKRFWPHGQRVELVIMAPASTERRMFVERLSGMNEIQFRQYWIGQLFRTRATSAPRAVPDRATAVALVAGLPGALTLVAPGPLPPEVKLVLVDGLSPDDARYPLR